MVYKYYKFPTQGDVPNDDEWPANINIDQVGKILEKPGTYDALGNEITPPTYKNGWHVNICFKEGSVGNYYFLYSLEQYEINIKTPNRVWFGQII